MTCSYGIDGSYGRASVCPSNGAEQMHLQILPLRFRLLSKDTQGEAFMPTYEFDCEKCGNKFTLIITVREYEKEKDRFRCPKCKSKRVRQVFSPFVAKTTNKA